VFDTAQFAERLSSSHATMVDTTAMPDERERAGIDHQLVLRELADRTELDEEVLAALDPAARPAVERVVRARQFLQARTASRPPQPPPDELPAWTIVEPEPIEALLAYYAEAEQLTGVGWYWLAAIHLQETRMGRIQGVSSADAVGPMQFLPETWARCCSGDPTVTRDAIIGAATYLAQSGAPADMAAALYEYNPNEGYVAVVTAYAESLREEPELYTGYHAFQVFFGSSAGTVRLPVGYSHAAPIDAVEYLESNPQDAA
jgi:membrane-bound lytic murein transglycosylase B